MRMRDILGSTLLHAGLATAVLAVPSIKVVEPPRIYEVSLAVRTPRQAAAPPLVEASRPEATAPSPPLLPDAAPPAPAPPPPPTPKSADRPRKSVARPVRPMEPPASPRPVAPAVPTRASAGAEASSAPANAGPSAGGGLAATATNGLAAYGADAVDERPSVVRRVEPRYPEQARRRREEGKVLVRLVVDAQGRPTECTVLASEPAGTFDAAALEAVRRFRFRPGKLAGGAVATVVHIPFAFSLQ